MGPKKKPARRDPLEVRFADSLAHTATAALAVVASATQYEGLDQWAYVTFASLPDDLRRDILTVFDPFAVTLIFERLAAEDPTVDDFPSFVSWLGALEETAIETTIHRIFRGLSRKASGSGKGLPAIPPLDDEEAVLRFLRKVRWAEAVHADEAAVRDIAALLARPSELKRRVVLIVSRFWETVYRRTYEETRGVISRSMAYRRQVRYPSDFGDVFVAVTGKTLAPALEEAYVGLETLVLVPSCHAGPYIRFIAIDEERKTLVVIFNARARSHDEDRVSGVISSSFAPLKALADETRLEILGVLADGELYAQQIVDRLAITQPAVSRHLKLMVSAGILKERRESGMKFYRIRSEALTELAKQIAAFASWGSD